MGSPILHFSFTGGDDRRTRRADKCVASVAAENLRSEAELMEKLFEIVHEDEDLLVVNKPADLVCHPTKGDVYSSLISRARLYLGANAPQQKFARGTFEPERGRLVPASPVGTRRPHPDVQDSSGPGSTRRVS